MAESSAYIIGIIVMSIAGYYVRSLSLSGAVAAFITGCLIALGFRWQGLLILGAFFASSSFWSKYKKQQKSKLDGMLQKGDRRDWVQVAANGSAASIAALLFYITGQDIWMVAFLAAIAAANADTWASEIGVLSKRRPFYILTGKKVEKGTSGAVSLLGTFASFAGSFFVALVAMLVLHFNSIFVFWLIVFAGFVGSVVDTLLGATIQARYTCDACGLATEKTVHCGRPARLVKGKAWLNNDAVNIASIFIAAIMAVIVFIIIEI
ncbi:MAG: DUF92 domain-containing protein [Bacillus sp. (in: firmicutes)]